MSPANEGKSTSRSDLPEPNETGSSSLTASDGTATSRRHVLASAAAAGVAAIAGIGQARAAHSTGGDELWRVETGAESITAPTVVDGTVYLGTNDPPTDDVFYALDAARGDELWHKEWYNGATRAAPSVVDGTVYVAGRRLSALDAQTGETQWRSQDSEYERDTPYIRTSPTVFDGTIFTSATTTDLLAYNAKHGAVRWKRLGSNEWEAGSPIVVDDSVYVVEPSLSESDSGDVTGPGTAIAAYDSVSGTEQWHWGHESDSLGSLTAANGILFVADHERGCVHALDQQNGERRWTVSTDPALETRPTVVDDTLFVGGEGIVHAIDIEEGSRRRYDAAVSVPIPGYYQAPTVVGDTLFAGDSSSIYALDLVDGSVSWRFETGSEMIASPIVVDGTLYTGTHDGTIYALDAGVSGSSEDSRVLRGTDGHHHAWAETAAIETDPAEFTVEIDTGSGSVVAATETEVRITVENVGEQPGERSIYFSTTGITVAGDPKVNPPHFEESIALDGGESRTITRSVIPSRRYEGREITMEARLYEDEDNTSISVTRPQSGLGQFTEVAPVAALGGTGVAAYLATRRLGDEDSQE